MTTKTRAKLILSGSRLPLFALCGASARADATRVIEPVGEAARIGSAVHAAIAAHIEERLTEYHEGLTARILAAFADASESEHGWLVRRAIELLRGNLSDCESCEAEIPETLYLGRGVEISVTPDLTAESKTVPQAIYVVDWKTGIEETDNLEQLKAAACAMMQASPEISAAYLVTAYLRTGTINVTEWAPESAEAWLDDLRRRIANAERAETFSPGGHCRYCQRFFDCTGRSQLVRSVMSDLAQPEAYAITADNVAKAFEARRMADRVVRSLDGAIKDFIRANGPVAVNGKTLGFQTTKIRRVLPIPAWPVLEAHFSDTELAEIVDVSISAAEQIVKANAPTERGAKGKAIAAFNAALAAAGAIEHRTSERLTLYRPDEAAEEGDNG